MISSSYQEKIQKTENVKSNNSKFMKKALLTNEFEKLDAKMWHEAEVVNRKTSEDTFMASSLASKEGSTMSSGQGTVFYRGNTGSNPNYVGTRSNNGVNQANNPFNDENNQQRSPEYRSEFIPTNRSANSNYIGNTQARTVGNALTGGYGGSRTGDGGYNGGVGGLRYGQVGNSNMSTMGGLGFATPGVAVPIVPRMVDPLIEPIPPRIISPPMATYNGAVLPGAATYGLSNMGRVVMGPNTFSAGGVAGVGGLGGMGGMGGMGGVGGIPSPLLRHSSPAIVPGLHGVGVRSVHGLNGDGFGDNINNGFRGRVHGGIHGHMVGHGHLRGHGGLHHFSNDNRYYGEDNAEDSPEESELYPNEQEYDNEDLYSRKKTKPISDEEKVSKIKDDLEKNMSSYNLNEELNVIRFHLDKKELDKVSKEVRQILADIKADSHKIEKRSIEKNNKTINSIIKDINKLKNSKQESPKNSYYQSSSKKILPVLFEIKDFINAYNREESIKNHPVENSHKNHQVENSHLEADITEITVEAGKKKRNNLKKHRSNDHFNMEDNQINSDDENDEDEELEGITEKVNKSTLRKLEKRIDELTEKVKSKK